MQAPGGGGGGGGFTGMDVPAVRQLSQQMNHSAQEIRQLMHQLTSALQNVQWVGPDREHFLSEWQGQHVSSLNHVAQGLEDASHKANHNAQQQEQTSNSL